MFSIFKKNPIGAILLTLVFSLTLWVPTFLDIPNIQNNVPLMPLEHWCTQFLAYSPLLSSITACLLLYLLIMMLITLEKNHAVVSQQGYFSAFIFMLFCSAFPLQKYMNGAYLATFLFIIGLFFLFKLYKAPKVYASIFYAGMFISCAVLFFAPAVFLILLLPIALVLFRSPFSWREHVIALAGVVTPIFYTCIVYHFVDDNAFMFFSILHDCLFSLSAWIFESERVVEWAYLSYMLLLILQSMLMLMKGMFTSKIKVKKIHILLLWAFFILLSVSLFLPSGTIFLMPLLAVPASILIANCFIFTKFHRFATLQFIALIVLTFLTQYL